MMSFMSGTTATAVNFPVASNMSTTTVSLSSTPLSNSVPNLSSASILENASPADASGHGSSSLNMSHSNSRSGSVDSIVVVPLDTPTATALAGAQGGSTAPEQGEVTEEDEHRRERQFLRNPSASPERLPVDESVASNLGSGATQFPHEEDNQLAQPSLGESADNRSDRHAYAGPNGRTAGSVGSRSTSRSDPRSASRNESRSGRATPHNEALEVPTPFGGSNSQHDSGNSTGARTPGNLGSSQPPGNDIGGTGRRHAGGFHDEDAEQIPGPRKTRVVVKECEYATYYAVLYYVSLTPSKPFGLQTC